jgi:hypothetical protein
MAWHPLLRCTPAIDLHHQEHCCWLAAPTCSQHKRHPRCRSIARTTCTEHEQAQGILKTCWSTYEHAHMQHSTAHSETLAPGTLSHTCTHLALNNLLHQLPCASDALQDYSSCPADKWECAKPPVATDAP